MNLLELFIGAAIAIVVLANVYMSTYKGVSTAGWTTAEIALWGILGILGIVAIVRGLGFM